ncbi:hypothetical protein ES703_36808 [subsurface metagenome]
MKKTNFVGVMLNSSPVLSGLTDQFPFFILHFSICILQFSLPVPSSRSVGRPKQAQARPHFIGLFGPAGKRPACSPDISGAGRRYTALRGADLHQPPLGLHPVRQPAADPGLPAAEFDRGRYFALVVGDLVIIRLLTVVDAGLPRIACLP